VNSTRQIPEYVPRLIKFDTQMSELCNESLILTPNNRLSEVLVNAFVQHQIDAGRTAWKTPQIRSFGSFISAYYANLQLTWPDKYPAHLLSDAQQKLVWLSSSADLINDQQNPDWHALSTLAMDSWSTLHEWCIDINARHFQLNDTSAFYQSWMQLFKAKLRHEDWITHDEIPDLIRTELPRGSSFLPSTLVLYGFETETQQQTLLLKDLEATGTKIVRQKVNTVPGSSDQTNGNANTSMNIYQMPDEASELAHVANWARSLIEGGLETFSSTHHIPSVGIIVPDLERQHASIVRQFNNVFSPASIEIDPLLRSFNISGGVSLSRSTVCSDALRLLYWTGSAISPQHIESLGNSPYLVLPGVDSFKITKNAALSMASLNHRLDSEFLRNVLAIDAIKNTSLLSLSSWATVFTDVLKVAGWPVLESLESVHFQAAERLNRVLKEMQNDIDILAPCNLANAVGFLETIVAQVKFSPESSHVPVQIMTALEADGLGFDHVWLMGFHDRAWPANPGSNPFIPRKLLLEKEVPRSSLKSELDFARRYIGNLLDHSEQLNFSYAQFSGDQEFEVSKLIDSKTCSIESIGIDAAFHPLADSSGIQLEIYNDFQAPRYVQDTPTKGGSGLLTDQSNCAFLALANHRLNARTRTPADAFPDASDRGNILHGILELLFTRIDSHATLLALSQEDRTAAILSVVESCVMNTFSRYPEHFRVREKIRLLNLVEQWVLVELNRPAFHVVGTEEKVICEVAGLHLSTRVDRIDIDVESGSRIIVDYKTGKVRVKDWGGERLRQPQLPLYALQNVDTTTLFYAQVRDTECKYSGMSDIYPLAKTGAVQILSFAELGADDWTTLLNNWRIATETLSKEFQAGFAEVNPLSKDTCKYCEFQPLCRINAQEKHTHG